MKRFFELARRISFKSLYKHKMGAILNSRMEDFTGCSIYVYRETPTGKLGTSYPCKHCKRMIESLNFKDIHYTNYDGYQWEIL